MKKTKIAASGNSSRAAVDGIIVLRGQLSDSKLKSYAKEVSIVVTGRRLRAQGAVQPAD